MPFPAEEPKVLMVLDGLLIGSSRTAGTYQMGVLPALNHRFSILVNEFQKEIVSLGGDRTVALDSLIRSRVFTFSDFPLAKKSWTFNVINPAGPEPARASVFDSGRRPVRIDGHPTPDEEKDHRWPLSLDDSSDFPEHGRLTKQADILNPIINFNHGLFHTRQRFRATPAVFRKVSGEGRQLLGVISKQFAANIYDIESNGELLLKDGHNEEIFRLVFKTGRRFAILFQNTPSHEHSSTGGVPSHFPVVYTAFKPSLKRYDLVLNPEAFPGTDFEQPENLMGTVGAPAPFRCGPVLVDDTLD